MFDARRCRRQATRRLMMAAVALGSKTIGRMARQHGRPTHRDTHNAELAAISEL
jgi:hypothetical protein